MNLDPKTVRKYLRMGSAESSRSSRRKALDGFKNFLWNRWQAGTRNLNVLLGELREMGSQGSYRTLQRFVFHWKTEAPICGPCPKVPKPRELKFWFTKTPKELSEEDRSYLIRLQKLDPEFEEMVTLSRTFASILLDNGNLTGLEAWFDDVSRSNSDELKSFANGLKKDRKAVEAAIIQPWSNGQVEGQVNKIKAIKRQMYGRASFECLRKRLLLLRLKP